jgi:hypothetical protein
VRANKLATLQTSTVFQGEHKGRAEERPAFKGWLIFY